MNEICNSNAIMASIIFSLIGIVILTVSFVIIEKITPENIYKQIVEKGNTAIAIIAGAFILAIAIIIAASIHG